MLNVALNIDIEQEIERRIRGARRNIEESKDTTEYEQYDTSRSAFEDPKKKKKVNFASPERYSSVHSNIESSLSSKHKSSTQKFEDSIGESIKIEESYTISQQTVSNLPIESSKRTVSDAIKESIKESVAEEDSSYY